MALYLGVVLGVTMWLGPAGGANAGDVDKVLNAPRPTQAWTMPQDYRTVSLHYRERLEREMLGLQRALQDKPERLWTDDELNEYLEQVCWYVYDCFNFARGNQQVRNNNLPLEMDRLYSQMWVPVMPKNPFRNWEPVKIVPLSAGFSAGDIFVELPPPELWGDETDAGFTHACGIYGRDEQWQSRYPRACVNALDGAEGIKYSWISVPPGTAMIVSAFGQTNTYSEYQISHGYS
jgi:hypothetical protein